ncbi:MAG: RICIN domain-containing protein [Prevotella sp.]|nr:RICIN domain-containing protein [Prevotella sp.]
MVRMLILLASLLWGAAGASAQQSLNIHGTDGKLSTFSFADSPVITFGKQDVLTIEAAGSSADYSFGKLGRIDFIDGLNPLKAAASLKSQATGVYVGGHIRRNRPSTITKLKHSGFTYVILFNVTVESDGTLTTDGETICKDGKYVFGNTQPNYASDIKSLKTAPTSISRIEICIGGWGNESYDRIKSLVGSQGTGSSSILYRNFKALKDAIPVIDAVNNDDEHCYDSSSAVKFHEMMYALGYKTTLAPYTNKSFWSTMASQLGGKCDRVLVQCYDGGAGNNPSDWHLNNVTLHAGRTNYQTDMNTSVNQMKSWKNSNGVKGGFVWVYNDETWNLNAWATAMNRVFETLQTDYGVATFYQDKDYGGYAITLPEGSFTQADMALYGLTAKDVSSLKVTEGYKVTLYTTEEFGGDSKTWTSSSSWVGDAWNDNACSIKIEPNGKSGLSGIWKIKNRNSGKFLDLTDNRLDNNTAVVQWDDEGLEDFQQWELKEVSTGVYAILAAKKNTRGLDVVDGSKDNGTQVQLYDYLGSQHQQFILYEKEEGYYMFVARHCGKVVEMPKSSTNSGEWIKIWDNNGTHTQQWQLLRNTPEGTGVAIFYKDANYGGSSASLSEGDYNTYQMNLFGIADNDITSMKILPGFKVTVYKDDNFSGESRELTGDTNSVGSDWNDMISSIRIEASGVGGKSGKYRLQGYNSQLFWDVKDASTDNNALMTQQAAGIGASQEFRLKEQKNGVYNVINLNSGRYLDVQDASCEQGAAVQQYDGYPESHNQQWILVDKGSGCYQLVARHSGMVAEVPADGRKGDEELKMGVNNGQKYSWWQLHAVDDTYSPDLSGDGTKTTASHNGVNDAESIEKLFDDDPMTKFCARITAGEQVTMTIELARSAILSSYTLTSANDEQGRDPKTWSLQGSTDGYSWTTIDRRTGEIFPERYQRKAYAVASVPAYARYRLLVEEQHGEGQAIFQLAEWQLFGVYDDATGVQKVDGENARLRVYPNPATDYITIAQAAGKHVSIFDTMGRIQIDIPSCPEHCRIDVCFLPKGTYIVRAGGKSELFLKK